MKKILISLMLIVAGCYPGSSDTDRSCFKDLSGMSVSEVSHTDKISKIKWSVPADYEAITITISSPNFGKVRLPELPVNSVATASFYTSKGGKLLFSDKSDPHIISPGQTHTFEKEIDILRETAAAIGYWEATVGPAK